MEIDDLSSRFGSLSRLSILLAVSQSNMSHWRRRGSIPIVQQMRIEVLTGGQLKTDRTLLAKVAPELAALLAAYERMSAEEKAAALNAVDGMRTKRSRSIADSIVDVTRDSLVG
jgi:hypothetical protein